VFRKSKDLNLSKKRFLLWSYLSGFRARSSRKTRRMPKMRGLVEAVSEMTRSTREMTTSVPSMMFQPLRRYVCSVNAIPLAITCQQNGIRVLS